MDEKELQLLYNAISSQFDVGDFNAFRGKMQTTEQRKSFYDVVSQKGFDIGDYDSYEQRVGGVKKKGAGGIGAYGASLLGGEVGTSNGLLGGVIKGMNEEREALTNVITQTGFKKNERPFDQTKDEAIKGATLKLNDIMYGEGSDWKDPIKAAEKGIEQSKDIKEASDNLGVKTITELSLMPNGYEAKKTLAGTILGQMGDDNLTAKALRERADKYDRSVQPLRDIKVEGDLSGANEEFLRYNFGGQLNNAAIKYYAEKHPEFKKQMKIDGIDINDPLVADKIPSGKRGAIKGEFFNDPDIMTYLEKENPNLIPAFQVAEKYHLTDDTDYGINVVANKVSKAVQKTGYNAIEPIFNIHDKGHEEMNDLVANEVLTPQELEIWQTNIKNNQAKYMDEPSLFEGVATGIKNTLGSTGKLITEPFTSEAGSVLNQWHKEASNVSADPEGLSKFLQSTGNVLGFLMTLGATQSVTGLGAVNALTLATTGDIIQESREKYRGEPIKAGLSGLLNVALYRALGKSIFPVDKAKKAFTSVRPKIDEIVENLTAGKITQDAARKDMATTLGKAVDLAGGTIAQDAKITAELTGLQLINRVFDKVSMDDESFKKYHDENEISEGAEHYFLSNLVVAGLGKFGQMKNANNAVSESIYEASSRPNEFKRAVDNNLNLSFADANEIKANADYGALILNQLNKKGIPKSNQKRFLFEALQEKAKTDLTPETGETTIDKAHKEELKEHQEVKERILMGEDHENIVTKAEQKRIDETEKAESEIQSLTKQRELDNKSFDLKLKDLDGRNSEDNIKKQKIQQQRKDKNDDYDKKIEKIKSEKPQEVKPEPTEKKIFNEELPYEQKYKPIKFKDPVTGIEKQMSVKAARRTMEKQHNILEKFINCL